MTKTKYSHRIIAVFLTLNFLTSIIPVNYLFANNNGPTSPDVRGFEPINVNDMVNLLSGDLSYTIPLLSVGGYPMSLSYHSGVTTDLDASWVGLGWYLTPGAINRHVQGTPDDWRDGVGIDFTSYHKTEEYHSIGVSYGGFDGLLSAGTEFSWGEGKGLTVTMWDKFVNRVYHRNSRDGKVRNDDVGFDIGGGYSVSQGDSEDAPSLGGGVSYNTATGNTTYSLGVSGEVGGGKASLGVSFSDNGYAIGASYAGYGANYSNYSDSFSSGDYSVKTQSDGYGGTMKWGPGILGVKYTKKKVNISLRKGREEHEWGVLYGWDYGNMTNANSQADGQSGFNDYQNRRYGYDAYSTEIPQLEEEFTADYSKLIEKPNFTFAAYDNYGVSAQGISGSMTPRLLDNTPIFSKGTKAQNTLGQDIHGFWHHGTSADASQRSFGQSNYNGNTLNFYFNGHFTSKELVNPSSISSTGNNMTNFAYGGGLDLNESFTDNNTSGRAKSPNFVEVFTNGQIASNYATNNRGLIIPSNISNSDRGNNALFSQEGIGAYKITSTDGKTYHYSLPVYHFERIQRNLIENGENADGSAGNVKEKRQFTRFATHWLLTAITGPDYIDTNNNNMVDEDDYGYWLELEYGKWSDGFVWRSPYEDDVMEYYTNLKGHVESKDKGHYQFGRKQLYYLDKIKSKEQTAVFVKDIRYDAVGKDLQFKYNHHVSSSGMLTPTGVNLGMNQTHNIHVRETNVNYEREYSLKLNKIVVLNTEDANLLTKNSVGTLGSGLPNYTRDTNHNPQWQSPYYNNEYSSTYSLHNESLVYDINDVTDTFIANKALNVIELSHSYDLAPNSPSSKGIDPSLTDINHPYGKLTLDEIRMNGRGNSIVMPPYKFEYYLENMENLSLNGAHGNNTIPDFVEYKRDNIDAWGFLKNEYNGTPKIKAWNLKEITFPTGANLEFDYEEDDYWTEAFARRYWTEELQFTIDNLTIDTFDITIRQNTDEINLIENISFLDYFSESDPVFFDMWLAVWDRDAFTSTDREIIDIVGQSFLPSSVGADELKFTIPRSYIIELDDTGDLIPHTFRRTSGNGSEHPVCLMHRGGWGNCNDGFNLVYKLLANKVPEDETGGGLRVKQLISSDENNVYKKTYDYSHPTKLDHNNQPRTSGITSFSPVKGLKYVPYQSELPAPGVMYEYVTVKDTDQDGHYMSKTRYQHHVIKPVFNIFNPEITMESNASQTSNEDKLFWAEVEEQNISNGEAKKINIHVNTAIIGQLKSMEVLNSEDHLLYKVNNEYINGANLTNEPNKGHIKESFNAMKTIFTTNTDGTVVNNTKNLLSVSTKTEYNNMLKKTVTVSGNQSSEVEYFDADPWLGSFRKSKSTLADNSIVWDIRVPAYSKYPEMGSKVLDFDNKNMLKQNAMNVMLLGWDESKTLSASISAWDDTWLYRDNNGNVSQQSGVWRKSKNYIWKDGLNNDGTYTSFVDEYNDYFDWSNSTPTNSNWQKASEVTKYTHWSSPLEIKDINGNYASSKMADSYTKTIASGNAKYTEMYYSGAEYVASGNVFEGEVKGANYRTSEVSHTGDYAVKTNAANDKVFEISGIVGASEDFREGTYKVSFWAHQQDGTDEGTQLKLNNQPIDVSETVSAGCWKQFNYYVDLPSGMHFSLYATNSLGSNYYFDDFRMHPVYATMNSYVYDQHTNELLYILDANNIGTAYRYNDAGRLKASYAEVEDAGNLSGGFKVIQQYDYHYRNLNTTSNYNEDINRCINPTYPPLSANYISRNCIPEFNTYDIEFRANPTGGSGQYSYEWQWLINTNTQEFSNWIAGSNTQLVPYAAKYCSVDKISKHWEVKLKVTDLVTGEIAYSDDQYYIDDCATGISNPKNLLGVEASRCHGECRDSEYMFHIYPLDGLLELPSPISYVDNNSGLTHTIDLVNGDGLFCPSIKYVESSECASGYIAYASITPIYPSSTGVTYDFYLNCVDSGDLSANPEFIGGLANDPKYAKPGIMLVKKDGKIISAHDITKTKK